MDISYFVCKKQDCMKDYFWINNKSPYEYGVGGSLVVNVEINNAGLENIPLKYYKVMYQIYFDVPTTIFYLTQIKS